MASSRLNITINAVVSGSFHKVVDEAVNSLKKIETAILGLDKAGSSLKIFQTMENKLVSTRLEVSKLKKEMADLGKSGDDKEDDKFGELDALDGSIAASIKSAAKFSTTMAELKKGIKFENPAQAMKLRNAMLKLAHDIPLSKEALAGLMKTAVNAKIPLGNLVPYTRIAGKMATAFGMSADTAGEAILKWRSGMGITIRQSEHLADTVSHLSKGMNVHAASIARVLTQQGAAAKTAGISAKDAAALSTSLLASGATTEQAAASMAHFSAILGNAGKATKEQRALFAELGIDATDLAQRMKKDAGGAIEFVLGKLAQNQNGNRSALAEQLFGTDAVAIDAKEFSKAAELASDEVGMAKSMSREFHRAARSADHSAQILANRIDNIRVQLGKSIVPGLIEFAEFLSSGAVAVADFAREFPTLAKSIVYVAGAWAVFKLVSGGIGNIIGDVSSVHRKITDLYTEIRNTKKIKGISLSQILDLPGRTQKGLSGILEKYRILNRATLDFTKNAGGKTASSVKKMFSALSPGNLVNAFGNLKTKLLQIPGLAKQVYIAIGGKAVNGTAGIFGFLKRFGTTLLHLGRVAIPFLWASLKGLAVAVISNPYGAAIAAIAAALVAGAVAIYKYWEPITSWLGGFFDGIGQAVAPAINELKAALEPLAPLGEAISKIFTGIGDAIGDLVGWFGELFEPVKTSKEELQQFREDGLSFGKFVGEWIATMIKPLAWALKGISSGLAWIAKTVGLVDETDERKSETRKINTSKIGAILPKKYRNNRISNLELGSSERSNAPRPAPQSELVVIKPAAPWVSEPRTTSSPTFHNTFNIGVVEGGDHELLARRVAQILRSQTSGALVDNYG